VFNTKSIFYERYIYSKKTEGENIYEFSAYLAKGFY